MGLRCGPWDALHWLSGTDGSIRCYKTEGDRSA